MAGQSGLDLVFLNVLLACSRLQDGGERRQSVREKKKKKKKKTSSDGTEEESRRRSAPSLFFPMFSEFRHSLHDLRLRA